MGEGGTLSELRGILVVLSFLSIFILLVAAIPPQFGSAYDDYRRTETPEYYEASNVVLYNSTTLNVNFTKYYEDYDGIAGYWGETFDLGSYKFLLGSYNSTNAKGYDPFYLAIYYDDYPLGYKKMDWRIQAQIFHYKISYDQLDTLASEYDSLTFTVEYGSAAYTLTFSWDETKYTKPSDASDADTMKLIVGMTWDQMQTKLNAWTLLGQLLFFQLPNIHWAINAFIAIPIWITFAYLVFALVVKLIPFL